MWLLHGQTDCGNIRELSRLPEQVGYFSSAVFFLGVLRRGVDPTPFSFSTDPARFGAARFSRSKTEQIVDKTPLIV